GLARDEGRAVPDPFLTLERLRQVGRLSLWPKGDVADRVVGICLRIRLPDLDTGLHELAHRRLEVVVADDAARDSRSSGARLRLLQDDDVLPGPEAALRKLLRQVVGRRQAVDAAADDDVGGGLWERAHNELPPRQ